jgi:hypothetical protein
LSGWAQSFSLAMIVATMPLMVVYRIFQNLPDPLVISHGRWPVWANAAVIAAVTLDTAVLIRLWVGGTRHEPVEFTLQFLIAALIYVFGFVLLVRQYSGLYPEYFVTTGRSGLAVRKALYRNVVDIERERERSGETHLSVHMRGGARLRLALPTRDLGIFFEAIKKSQPDL